MRTRKLLCTLIALAMVLGVMPLLALSIGAQETVNVTNGEYSLKLEKSEFKKGEPIFVTATGNSDNDWIGISKAGSSAYIDYHYLGFAGNGIPFDVLQKSTSYAAGEYDIFLVPNNKSYNASTVVAKTTVTITDEAYQGTFEDPKTDIGDTTKLVTKDGQRVFKKGEPIYISATGNSKDWIGFYDDVYDESYSAYRYVSEMGGSGVYYDITSYHTFAPGTHFIRFIQDGSAKPYETYTIAGIYITVTDEQYVAPDEGGDSGEGEAGGTEGGGTEDVEIDTANSVTASNSTHSMTVNKTKFEAGESIWISAQGVGSKDWIGIAQRGYTEGTIRWYYISDAGNGNFYDVKQAPNIGGSLSAYASIPEGLYTLYLIENDGFLRNGFTLSINISVGNVEDTENGKITVTGQPEQDTSEVPSAPTGVTYEINDSTSGFAGGTISVTMPAGETSNRAIVMYWANESGRLDGYTSLARFKVSGEVTSFTFTESMIVPKGATKLLVYSQNTSTGALSEEFVSVELPSGSDMKDSGEIITSFFIISDIHIGRGGGTVSATNFKKMLNEAIKLNPNGVAIFIVGDMADNGSEAQFKEMMSLHAEVMEANGKNADNYPLFLTLGNHDYPAMSSVFLKYATLPNGEHPQDTSYDFWLNGYHYIFLGSDTSSGLYANLSGETLEWLEQKLGECRDTSRPTFVFLHQPMYNTVSGSLPGEGWHGVSNENELRAVLSKYPEAMLFNGHTHWTMDSIGNIFEGTEELPIHIFNCASVSYLWSGFNKVSGEDLAGSQGYYIEMYDGKVFVRGRDFVSGEWISSAQYLIEFTESSEGNGHTYEQTISYENGYAKEGVITYVCSACGESKEEVAPALFTVLGYSLCEDGQNGIAVGYRANGEAIEAYERITGKSLSYGVFAAQKDKLSERDLFDENGKAISGVISADITSYGFASFQLKILGFEDAYKEKMLAMGAYIKTINGETASYSYLQAEAPSTGEKYSYTSYNKVVASKEEDAK